MQGGKMTHARYLLYLCMRFITMCDQGAGMQRFDNATIISSPPGTAVSGSNNTFVYPIMSSVTLTCTPGPPPISTVNYAWMISGCTACFPNGVTEQNATTSSLTPDDAGTFTCSANAGGSLTSSDPFTLRVSYAPSNVTATVLSSRSVEVMWNAFSTSSGVTGYFISYTTTASYTSGGNETVNDVSTASYTLSNLEEYTNYTITVRATSNSGMSDDSDRVLVKTYTAPPSSPPQNVMVTSLDRASLNVTWEPIPPIDENGPNTGYLITYHITGDQSVMSHVAAETNLTIPGLNPYVNYSVQVAARNINGSGSFSSIITQLSGQDLPTAPRSLSVNNVDDNTITLSWMEPNMSNGIIISYQLEYKIVDSDDSFVSVNSTSLMYTVTGSTPRTGYQFFRAAAYTRVGRGPYSSILVLALTDPTNVNVTVDSSRSIMLTWEQPSIEEENGLLLIIIYHVIVIETQIHYTDVGEEIRGIERYLNRTYNVSEGREQLIGMLHPDYNYTVSIAAATEQGMGPFSDPITVRTNMDVPTAAPRNVSVTVNSSHSIMLTWERPLVKEQNGLLLIYHVIVIETQIHYTDDGVEIRGIERYLNRTYNVSEGREQFIEMLHPDYNYTVSIAAATEQGIGPFSDPITVRTNIDVPTPTVSVTALSNQTVGQSLTLQCEVTIVRGITSRVDIVWSSGVTVLQRMNNVSSTMMNNSLVYTNSYTISQLSTTDDGRVIQCEGVINAGPSVMASDDITLDVTVPPPTVILSPSDAIQGAMVGSPQVINCTVSTISGVKSSSVMISWTGPGGAITNDGRVTFSPTTSSGSNYTSSLQFASLLQEDTGNYRCNVTILDTQVSQSVELQSIISPFQINVTARGVQLVGGSLVLDCTIRDLGGETNSLEIIWMSNDTILQRTNVTKIEDQPDYKDSYNISQLTTSDRNRSIQCMARSLSPPIINGSNIMLNIIVPTPTVNITPPDAIQGAMVGNSQLISCTVSTVSGVESSLVIISWIGHRGDAIMNNTRMTISPTTSSGNNYTSSLQFAYLLQDDEGNYTCFVAILEANGSQSVEIDQLMPPDVAVVSDPSVSGFANLFEYPILSNVTLTCMVDPLPPPSLSIDVFYQWNTEGCYNRTNFNDGIPRCFPYNQTTRIVVGNYLTAEDAGTITCTVTISGSNYTSEPYTLLIAGIAITGEVLNQVFTDFLYINAGNNNVSPLAARCITGLSPSDDDNAALGGWYFNGAGLPIGECNDSTIPQSNGADISNYVGVIDLLQCGTFSFETEGVYTCIIMNSAMRNHSMRVGMYLDGRTAPTITNPSSSTITVSVGSPLTLNCTSRGSPPDTFIWRKDDNPTKQLSTNMTAVEHTNANAVFRTFYSFGNVTMSDSGTYRCIVTNPIGSDNATVTVVVEATGDADTSSGGSSVPIGALAGAIVGVVIVILVILIVGCIMYRLYLVRSKQYEPRRVQRYSISKSSLSTKNKQSPLMISENDLLQPNTGDIPMETINHIQQVRLKPIPCDEFHSHVTKMHENRDYGFEDEYQTFSSEPLASCDIGKLPVNRAKNRYGNIFAYDFSRVKLQQCQDGESDYINSCYIDGYLKPNAYIASQAPLPDTTKDFWQMVWDNKVPAIVMLTKLVEAGKPKCHKYWPDKVGESVQQKEHISVKLTALQYFADYEIRTMEVTNSLEKESVPLELKHYFYTSWPDHGVPEFATSVIALIKKVRQAHVQNQCSPPLLIHCSAGVGRTGTYIALDIMLQQMPKTNTVNVYECVRNMRAKRLFMVQTLAQYVFLHDALDEVILCGETAFNVQNLRVKMTRMSKTVPGKHVTGFQEQFKSLEFFCRQANDATCADAFNENNVQKNRYKNMVPFNDKRVVLRPTKIPGSNYINASFIDGYKERNAFIATQCPLENTVNDFWRMIWEFKSSAIVMLCDQEHDKNDFFKYWPDFSKTYDKITVQPKSEEDKGGFVIRKFTVTGEQVITAVVPINLTMLHYTEWPNDEKATNTKALLSVIKELLTVQQNTGNRSITVMCNNGCGRTGTFITIYTTLERIKTDGSVDIFQIVKSTRLQRPNLVTNAEQYVYSHEVVAEYLEDFDKYDNFK